MGEKMWTQAEVDDLVTIVEAGYEAQLQRIAAALDETIEELRSLRVEAEDVALAAA
jgi:hypothetical protein